MKKTFFLIPGFQTQISDDEYTWLVRFLEENKLTVMPVPVHWSRRTVTQNAEEFLKFFNQHKSEINYVLGFSFGAVIALVTAEKTNPSKLFLCSLSPDFSEDVNDMPIGRQNYIGKKRFLDDKTRSARTIAKKLVIPTTIFYGEKEALEYPPLKKRAEETVRLAQNAKLVLVPEAPHEIDFPSYQNAIKLELLK